MSELPDGSSGDQMPPARGKGKRDKKARKKRCSLREPTTTTDLKSPEGNGEEAGSLADFGAPVAPQADDPGRPEEASNEIRRAIENAEEFRDPLEGLVEKAGLDHSAPLKPDVVERLAEVKRDDLAAFAELREELKRRGTNMRLLDEAVKTAETAQRKPLAQAQAVPPFDVEGLPVIKIRAGKLPAVVNEAEQALINANLGFYQRGSMIVRIALAEPDRSTDRKIARHSLVPVGPRNLAEAMTRSAHWLRYDKRAQQWVRADASVHIAQTYLERVGQWKLKRLTNIINCPTLRRDDSILDKVGYDEETGLLFLSDGEAFPQIPREPSRDEALEALGRLRELICTFPFEADADRSVALSAILTAVIRHSLPTAPLHGFTSPTAGSGKSMLVDITSIIAMGCHAAVIAQGKTEEEMEKRLGAALIAGDRLISIDNCQRPLGGDLLCHSTTQQTLKVRLLGKSLNVEVPSNALICATGNNLTLIGDMTRRAVLCSLDPGCERPELREFTRDPIAEALSDRVNLVVAALTILRAYHVAGRPPLSRPLGSFVEWSGWVRDSLIWLGEADPCATMEKVRGGDPKLELLASVTQLWAVLFGDQRVTARKMIDEVSDRLPSALSSEERSFRDALTVIAGDGGNINARRLGRWLGQNQNRVAGELKIVSDGKLMGTQQWRVVRV